MFPWFTCFQVETSVTAMLALGEGQMDVIEPEKVKNRKGYTNSGHLVAAGAYIEKKPTFTQVCDCCMICTVLYLGIALLVSFCVVALAFVSMVCASHK